MQLIFKMCKAQTNYTSLKIMQKESLLTITFSIAGFFGIKVVKYTQGII